MFISAVNIPSEQKAGLKRELSQKQEGLFKEKKMLNFCCSEGKKKKKEKEANTGMEYYSIAHTQFFFFSLVAFIQNHSVQAVIICGGK